MKIKRVTKILVLLLLVGIFNEAVGQTKISITSDSRFIGNIKGEYTNDPTAMLKDFTLGIEWWTLLGEPVQNYGFSWNTTGSFKIKIKRKTHIISRNSLKKYPDLLKRFNNISPIKIEIIVYGNAIGKTSSVKRGDIHKYPEFYQKGSAYKTKGQSYDPYTLEAHVLYLIKDYNFLTGKSGKMSYALIGSSPRSWNYFLAWRKNTSGYTAPYKEFDYLVLNKNEPNFKKLNTASKNRMNETLKHLFKNTTSFSLEAEIVTLEWPESEMRFIAETFLNRESKKETKDTDKKKLTSTKKKKSTNNWNLNDNKTKKVGKVKSNNDWGDLSDNKKNSTNSKWGTLTERVTKKKETYKVTWKNGLQGVINPLTKEILIPFKKWKIIKYKPAEKIALVRKRVNEHVYKVICSREGKVEVIEYLEGYVDLHGNWIIDAIKTVDIDNNYKTWNGFMMVSGYGNSAATAAKIKAVYKKCRQKTTIKYKAVYANYKSRGYKIY